MLGISAVVTCFVLLPEEKVSHKQISLLKAEANWSSLYSLKVKSLSPQTLHNSQK